MLGAGSARADGLVLFAAGSLREAMTNIAHAYTAAQGVPVTTEFGPSGRLRERIEGGEHVDVFASADIGHPKKLVADGRASVFAMFARNSVCLLIPRKHAAAVDSSAERLLASSLRIGVSPAKIDPLGDYTELLFDKIEAQHPGARAALSARSVVIDLSPGAPPPHSGDPFLDGIEDGRIDIAIVYCSGRSRYARLIPDAQLTPFPPELQVGPEYGVAVLKDAPADARLLALFILSPEGQRLLSQAGLQPVALPAE
jgi:ABC-type molybdate transport system substrate-binding protein